MYWRDRQSSEHILSIVMQKLPTFEADGFRIAIQRISVLLIYLLLEQHNLTGTVIGISLLQIIMGIAEVGVEFEYEVVITDPAVSYNGVHHAAETIDED